MARRVGSAVVALAWCLLLATPPAHAQAADPGAVVGAHYAAWTRVDRAAVLATLAEDPTIDDNGTPYAGREQIEPWLTRFLTPDQNLVLANVRVEGQRVRWEWTRLGDTSRQKLGVPFSRGEGEALGERGRIVSFAIRPYPGAAATYEADFRAALGQAATARATQVAQTAPAAAVGTGPSERGAPTAGQLVLVAVAAVAVAAAYAGLRRPVRVL